MVAGVKFSFYACPKYFPVDKLVDCLKIVKPRNVIYEDFFLNHPIKQAFFKKVLLFYISIPVLRISA